MKILLLTILQWQANSCDTIVPGWEAAMPSLAAATTAVAIITPDEADVPEPADNGGNNGNWVPFVAALLLFLLAVTGMSVGVLVRNRELKGSCGGLAAMSGQDGHSACDLCAIPKDQCRDPQVRARLSTEVAADSEA